MASGRHPSTSAMAAAWCNRLNQFCLQLQKTCTSLHATVQRKPEPESRGDNVDSFLEDLNDDVSSALAKLQQLEERTTDTLSFEELLVHGVALYKSNEDGISKLELQLQQYGYTRVEMPKEIHAELMQGPTSQESEIDSQNTVEAISPPRSRANLSSTNDYEAPVVTPISHSYDTRNTKREAEYSPLLGDLGDLGSLESLGISATSLTALAGQDESGSVHPLQHKLTFAESPAKEDAKISFRDAEMEDNLKTKYGSHWSPEAEIKHPPLSSVLVAKYGSTSGNDERHPGPVVFTISEYGNGATSSIPTTFVSKKDVTVQSLETKQVTFLTEVTSVQYDSSPLYLKRMVSIQELNDAVNKINAAIRQRKMGGQIANQFVLDQDDIQALGFGSKAKAIIMLLTKADKLVTQKTNGVTAYRICASGSYDN